MKCVNEVKINWWIHDIIVEYLKVGQINEAMGN